MKISRFIAMMMLCAPWQLKAGEADVVDVTVKRSGDNQYGFAVTVRHDDQGWEHYANKWEVLSQDGEVLGTRVLAHPHDDEQPFTRSLSGVKVPTGITNVIIRTHDSQHEYGGKELTVELPR